MPQPLQTLPYRDYTVFSAIRAPAANPSLLEVWAYSRENMSCLIIYFMRNMCTKICCVRMFIVIVGFIIKVFSSACYFLLIFLLWQ